MEPELIRSTIGLGHLRLPPAPTPRRGDEVVWYREAQRTYGEYIGHGARSEPVVMNQFGRQTSLKTFDCVRIREPARRVGPNWESLSPECILKPFPAEEKIFEAILNRQIPPGPSYLELAEEIWHRGYEVYVVGGTVRDVVFGKEPNDVDIVTTMPLTKFKTLLESMFPRQISVSDMHGYARLGGRGRYGDPFIDLKAFCHCDSGTEDVLFGSDFKQDLGLRDFACNAIYYDPINNALIDPSLRGLSDASGGVLALVCDPTARAPTARGQVAIRYFKFRMRGLVGESASDAVLAESFIPCISAMPSSLRISYVKRQILGKIPAEQHRTAIENLEAVIKASGYDQIWEEMFRPICGDLVQADGD